MKADPTHAVPAYDPVAVERLKAVLQGAFGATVTVASQSLQAQGERIAAALRHGDPDAARLAAHSMVSSAGVFGMLQLVAAARQLEQAGAQADWPMLQAEMQDRLDAALRLLAALQWPSSR